MPEVYGVSMLQLSHVCFKSEERATHCFLQTDLFELSHSGVEESLEGLLPLLQSCNPLSLQLAVLAALNIYTTQHIKHILRKAELKFTAGNIHMFFLLSTIPMIKPNSPITSKES